MIEHADLLAAGYQRRQVLAEILFEKTLFVGEGQLHVRFVEWDFTSSMKPSVAADHRWRPEVSLHLGPRRDLRVIYRAVAETTIAEVEGYFRQLAQAMPVVREET